MPSRRTAMPLLDKVADGRCVQTRKRQVAGSTDNRCSDALGLELGNLILRAQRGQIFFPVLEDEAANDLRDRLVRARQRDERSKRDDGLDGADDVLAALGEHGDAANERLDQRQHELVGHVGEHEDHRAEKAPHDALVHEELDIDQTPGQCAIGQDRRA